jgi:uncharacterized membrane protein YtjA (UPF0391 family)
MIHSKSSHLFGIIVQGSMKVRGNEMLKWALIFFIISIVGGLFGFTGIYAASGGNCTHIVLSLPCHIFDLPGA